MNDLNVWTTPARGRERGRRVVAALVTIGFVTVAPTAAWAHMSVQPDAVQGGGISVVSFRVPNERDDASTTRVRVLLPKEQPLGSVRTRPVPGWRVTTETRKLDEPVDVFGEQVDSVVSTVTWSATGEGVGPGHFEDFDVSIGPLPDSGEMVFTAVQTYSSGEVVKWNEVALDDSIELEHPAPVLTITAPESAEVETGAPESPSNESDSVADDDSTLLPLVLSGLALLASLAAVGLVARRRG